MDFSISNSLSDEENYQELISALGIEKVLNIEYCKTLEYLLMEVENDQIVENLTPNFQKMLNSQIPKRVGLVIVTSKSSSKKDFDFVSRCFAPWFAINEDPVTGSAHTILYPYWSKKLLKKELTAFQCSPRGGILHLQPSTSPDRLYIVGKATVVLRGHLFLD
ncbi:MAG: PhzF family phenazine biosynthesis protein [Candidatus Heimdallarchaeaceae archaeon]